MVTVASFKVSVAIPRPLVALTIEQSIGGYLERITPEVSFQAPNTYYYNLNTNVTVVARTISNYALDHFVLDGNPVKTGTNRITIQMDKNHTLGGVFIQISTSVIPPVPTPSGDFTPFIIILMIVIVVMLWVAKKSKFKLQKAGQT